MDPEPQLGTANQYIPVYRYWVWVGVQTQGYQSTISLVLCGSAPGYPPLRPHLPVVPTGHPHRSEDTLKDLDVTHE